MNEDKSARYRRLQRRASILAAAAAALLLVLLIVTGGAAALRDALAGVRPWAALLVFVVLLVILVDLLQLPFAYYKGVTLERRYGLSTQPVSRWLGDQVKGGAVGLALTLGAAAALLALMRWSPERWWIAAAVGAAATMVVLALAAPVVLLPLFYQFKPLQRAALAARLERLAGRAGTRVLGVFEWQLQDRTRKANAALTGIGRTRRILLSDTLLAEHSEDEIEVIVAHELAHHVHHDIWTSLALESAVLAAGLLAAERALEWSSGSFGLAGPGDLAALPVIGLVVGAVSTTLRPVVHALSRAHERRADRYALAMTGDPASFITAMKRLGAQNLAEERPSRLVELLFYTHPPMAARIDDALRFREVRRG